MPTVKPWKGDWSCVCVDYILIMKVGILYKFSPEPLSALDVYFIFFIAADKR